MEYYFAAALPIVSLLVYAVLFSIECGATLFIFAPDIAGTGGGTNDGDRLIRNYINPAWETTNVFLIFALLWLIAFFPGAVPVWGHALIVPFLVFLVIMGIRAVGMLYVFYKEGENRAMKFLLFIASFAAPMALAGGVLPYFITGIMPYGVAQWVLALCFAGAAFFSTIFISSSFFTFLAARRTARSGDAEHAPHEPKNLAVFARAATVSFIVVALFLFWALGATAPRIAQGMQTYLPLAIAIAAANVAFLFFPAGAARRYAGARFAFAIALFSVVFLTIMFSQLPYVIYPTMTIFSAFTDPASARIMLDAFGVGAIIILPSLGWLYYLAVPHK